jgi:hypothetical protein
LLRAIRLPRRLLVPAIDVSDHYGQR